MQQTFLRRTRKMNKNHLDFFVSLLIFHFLRQEESPFGKQEEGSEWQKWGQGSYLQHYTLGKIYPW